MSEIIIDGVDVSGCDRLRTFRDWTYSSDKWCGISNDGGCECEQNINCLYKQLKRTQKALQDIKTLVTTDYIQLKRQLVQNYDCLDNFMQVKYFDTEEENIFCSEECFCKYLMLEEIEIEEL